MFKLRSTPCTFNKTVYEEDKALFSCQGSINVYHCIQNERNKSGEICIQPVWVQPDYCPEYNTGANTLDTVPCNVSSGCPKELFLSSEVYKYPVCLNKTFADSKDFIDSKENVLSLPWIFVGIGVLLAVCLLVWFIYRRQIRRPYDKIPLRPFDEPEEPFYKTSAFYEGVSFLNNGGNILCLEGPWGSGKSSTAKQVYKAVMESSPVIISDPLTFDVRTHCKPIIVDILSEGISKIEKEQLLEKIRILFTKMSFSEIDLKAFIIFVRNEDWEIEIINTLVTQKENIKHIAIDLSSKTLSKGDRIQILSSQFKDFCPNKAFSKVEKLAMKGKVRSLGFPEICALFCRCSTFQQDPGPAIFCNLPLTYLKSHLKSMHSSEDNGKFLMLVYISLNQMEINVDNQNDMFFEILESCNCNLTTKDAKGRTEEIKITQAEVQGETKGNEKNQSEITRTEVPEETKSNKKKESVITPTDVPEETKSNKKKQSEITRTEVQGETKSNKKKQSEITRTEVQGETKSNEEGLSSRKNKKRDYLISLLPQEFVNKASGTSVYRLQHDVIKRMTLIVFGTYHFDKLLIFSKPEELKVWVKKKEKSVFDWQGDIEPTLEISGEHWKQFEEKLTKSLR